MSSRKVCLIGQIAVVVLAAASRLAAQEPPQMPPASPIEQALIERVCIAALDAAHDECASAKLAALRADFGRDLSKLSVADRRMLDDACVQLRTPEGRDAYIGCLDGQLTKIRARMTRAKPAAAGAAAADAPVSEPGGEPVPAENRASSLRTIVAGTAAGMFVAAGVAFFFLRSRRVQAPTTCSRCGAEMPESGSLCTGCRHEAAEEIRRAAAERAQQERAQGDFARREREELDLREQQARLEEAEQLREQELARQREEEQERLRLEDQAQRHAVEHIPVVVEEEETGPWAVLGVAKGAGPDEIYAAYQEAKAKYDPDFVSHLGSDAQEHFKYKALAVDAAYQQLMAALTSAV